MDTATLANLQGSITLSDEITGTGTEGTEGGTGTEPPAKTFTQEQVSAIAAKESKAAEARAQATLLASLGVENTDALKAALEAHKASEEANKSAEQRATELASQLEGYKSKAEAYQASVQALLDAELEAIPEDKRGVVPDFGDPAKTLAWVSANRAIIGGAPAPVVNVGTGATGSAQGEKSTVSFEDFKGMTIAQRNDFYKEFPEQAESYSKSWLDL